MGYCCAECCSFEMIDFGYTLLPSFVASFDARSSFFFNVYLVKLSPAVSLHNTFSPVWYISIQPCRGLQDRRSRTGKGGVLGTIRAHPLPWRACCMSPTSRSKSPIQGLSFSNAFFVIHRSFFLHSFFVNSQQAGQSRQSKVCHCPMHFFGI